MLRDVGTLRHDFVIEGTNFARLLFKGGDAGDVVMNLLAGEYVCDCSIAGHREAVQL